MLPNLAQLPAIPSTSHESQRRLKKRHKRELVVEPTKNLNAAQVLPEEVVSQLLNRSTAMILQSIGFSGAAAGVQERLHALIENYYLQMLQTINLFTLAQRRTKPTVLDYEEMFEQNHISLAELESELQRMPSTKPLAPLPPPIPPPPPDADLSDLLGLELDGLHDRRCHVHEHLPPFPSRHTYQQTPVFSERPTDPRMIREKATAEARLAEAALRKLLAVSVTKKDIVHDNHAMLGRKRKERHEEWKKAFQGLNNDRFAQANGHSEVESLTSIMNTNDKCKAKNDDSYLEVIVNSDSQFWRKGHGSAKRTQPA